MSAPTRQLSPLELRDIDPIQPEFEGRLQHLQLTKGVATLSLCVSNNTASAELYQVVAQQLEELKGMFRRQAEGPSRMTLESTSSKEDAWHSLKRLYSGQR